MTEDHRTGMKETPILMTPENAQKCHDGRKTMTRRVVKPQCDWIKDWGYTCFTPNGSVSARGTYKDKGLAEKFFKLPYGTVGDQLWVREAFTDCSECGRIAYRSQQRCSSCDHTLAGAKFSPSIHMPRWACRTVLAITEIRVERLQEISQADALAEGAPPSHPSIDAVSREFGYADFPRSWFAQLWESINGKDSWNENPWVWVIGFRKVKGETL